MYAGALALRIDEINTSSYTLGCAGLPSARRVCAVLAIPVSSPPCLSLTILELTFETSLFPFICPIQRYQYLVLFVAVQIWTIFIHDSDMISGHWTEKFINSPAHHTLHHMYFTVNYGQYFTWADSYFGSHRAPEPALDPLHDALKVMRAKGLVDEDGNPINKPKKE